MGWGERERERERERRRRREGGRKGGREGGSREGGREREYTWRKEKEYIEEIKIYHETGRYIP